MVRVLLFGALQDLAGWKDREIASARSVETLKRVLAAEDAELGRALSGPGVVVALNQAIVRGDAAFGPGAEIAFLPPMSGG